MSHTLFAGWVWAMCASAGGSYILPPPWLVQDDLFLIKDCDRKLTSESAFVVGAPNGYTIAGAAAMSFNVSGVMGCIIFDKKQDQFIFVDCPEALR